MPEWSKQDEGTPTTIYWQPRYGYYAWRSQQNDLLGYLFFPLIQIDRTLVHTSIGAGIRGSYDRSLRLRQGDIHPKWRAWFNTHMLPLIEKAKMEGKDLNADYQ